MKAGDQGAGVNRRSIMTGAAAALAGAAASVGAAQSPPHRAGEPAPRSRTRRPAPSDPDGGVSTILAANAVRARYGDIGEAAIAKAKLRLLDVVGCAIGGIRAERQEGVARVLAGSGRGEANVFGTGLRAPVRDAAMANAILSRAFDFEVMHVVVGDVQVPSHHSPTTVMSALALAEHFHADGRAFLTALSVGDDFAARTLAASGVDFNDGWDGVPLQATMAPAAIRARFHGLTAEQARDAIGLAADHISGTVQSVWDGTGSWKIHQGSAARNGILAAEMAREGWTGIIDPLLAPCGFYAQFTSGCARPDLLTAGLGREWHGEVYFKPWPSCAANHPTIETALRLRQNARLDPSRIDSVVIRLAPRVLDLFIAKPLRAGPSPHSQANFSIRFACANALLRGSLRQEHYAPGAMAEPALAALIARTRLEPLPPGAQGVVLEVTLRDGATHREALAGHPHHYPELDGTRPEEVEAKFRQQVAFAGNVPGALADEIVRRIARIEAERDMAAFSNLLARATRFPPEHRT